MKKLFLVLAIAGAVTACNNAADSTAEAKDSLDSTASERKEMIDSTAEQKKEAQCLYSFFTADNSVLLFLVSN